jgi:hypothetical protein
MKADYIRTQTALIIRKHGRYLVGREMYEGPLVWSLSRYDAWKTRDREKARDIARKVGGIVMLFNPIVGQERIL